MIFLNHVVVWINFFLGICDIVLFTPFRTLNVTVQKLQQIYVDIYVYVMKTIYHLNTVQIKTVLNHENSLLPYRAKYGDAGFDLFSIKQVIVPAQSFRIVPTGVIIEIPVGFYGQVAGRSSLASKGVWPIGGVIDSGYRGEIGVILYNSTNENFIVEKNDKVAQLVLVHIMHNCKLVLTDKSELTITERGANGFGSTGN